MSNRLPIFNTGQAVFTSSGKIGEVLYPQLHHIGFDVLDDDGYPVSVTYIDVAERKALAEEMRVHYQEVYPDVLIRIYSVPNIITLGGKRTPIWSNNLSVPETVTIAMIQNEDTITKTYSFEDGVDLINFCRRNHIWFQIINEQKEQSSPYDV